jgi:hypothetical protein
VLNRTFGCVRVVWNRTLAWRRQRYQAGKTGTTFAQASAYLTAMKATEELTWLNEVSSVPLQQAIRHQQAAYAAFFAGRARYPRFKSRAGRQCAEYTRSGFRWRDGRLHLAKMDAPLAFTWSWPGIDPPTSRSPATGSGSLTLSIWNGGPGTWPATSGGSPAASPDPRTAPKPKRRPPAPTARSAPPAPTSSTRPAPA